MRRRPVFADTFYWLALTDRQDQWHAQVRALVQSLRGCPVVTTDEVLVEVLNAFSDRRPSLRRLALATVREAIYGGVVRVIPQTRESLEAGLDLYARRPDKGYSLTDCILMETMRRTGLTEVLTHDHHFEQEGFVILLRD